MNQVKVDAVINAARDVCKHSYKGLTKNRQRVLEILLMQEQPISAYEIRDKTHETIGLSLRAMSVYRALEFLESMKLAHRVNAANKYLACKSLSAKCQHQSSLFLICKSCQRTAEIEAPNNIIQSFYQHIEAADFLAKGSQLEVITLCNHCKQAMHTL
ncbi:Fur family transcriptional regulator [Thalassotalea sediminis]|uniref:Fur family transcriptional regulator n=1 Tax=Thalassotalea sediminis TaxID=1759089 RepID=UPI0025724C70|nr:transcriptional repressor [Thalassotalea sediminis]